MVWLYESHSAGIYLSPLSPSYVTACYRPCESVRGSSYGVADHIPSLEGRIPDSSVSLVEASIAEVS